MLDGLKNKYLELEMDVSLRTGESITTVRWGLAALVAVVVIAVAFVGVAVAG
jgi:hypothetical protein